MKINPIFEALAKGFSPDPYITIDEWADKFRQLPKGASAEAGQYTTSRMPYLKEIMYELSPQSPTQQVKVIKGTQLGFTEVGNNTVLYYMDIVPSSQLMILPTETLAKDHSNRKLTPSLRAMPYLGQRITGGKSKDDIGGTFEKTYPGGMLKLGWAGSPANFRSLSCRIVILDDVDGFPLDADGEGNPVDLGKKRTDSFGIQRKIYINSTPTVKGNSNIEYEFRASDQRHYYMPCPFCKKQIVFEKDGFKFEYDKEKYDLKSDVTYVCPECGKEIAEHNKSKMLEEGKWIPHNPGHIYKGYRLPAYYSPLGFLSWNEVFREMLEAKAAMKNNDTRKMKTWVNTRDAIVWEEDFDKVEIADYESKKEFYTAQVPAGVLILTFGADTQDDRIECEIVGWGEAEESWSIAYKIFHGDTSKPEVWQRFDEFLLKTWTHENGGLMRVFCGGLDTQGHRAKQAYAFCKSRFSRRVFAFKGAKAIDAPISPRVASRNNKGNVPLYMIGVNSVKDVIYSHITTEDIGPGYMHFPQDNEYNAEYFQQLTAERRGGDGRWVKHRPRNEALDVRVYSYASLWVGGVDLEVLAHQGPLMFVDTNNRHKKKKQIKPKDYLEEF